MSEEVYSSNGEDITITPQTRDEIVACLTKSRAGAVILKDNPSLSVASKEPEAETNKINALLETLK